MQDDRDASVSRWLGQLREGDQTARDELIRASAERLARLTRKMLRGYPGVRRWEETDDVFNRAAMRLHKALKDVTPPSVADFYRFAAVQIRRQLIELARHYSGPHGLGANHESRSDPGGIDPETNEPESLALWTEFHEKVETMSPEPREVFDLLYYQGLSQDNAATILGVSTRTIKRRWRDAQIELHEELGGNIPQA